MNKIILILLLILTIIISGCTTDTVETQNTQSNLGMSCIDDSCGTSSATTAEIQKIEIIHFHGTNQCTSCIAVGDLAEETVNTYYADEIKSGKVTFAHINAELSENYVIAKKYGVTGSSLWIGTYTTNGQFKAEQNVNVWYKINNKNDYMTYLKGVIDQKLAGK